jgi:predicted Zn finger-like uncharacterized protein
MRITCPSCSSSFEIPSALLGKKGRTLKCASCVHSWYQVAQVEAVDRASNMGEDYAVKAKAVAGQPPVPAGQKGASQAPRGSLAVPPGGVSMMQRPQTGRAVGQTAVSWMNAPGADGNAAPGGAAVSWMEENAAGPGAPGQSMVEDGASGGPGAEGQAGRSGKPEAKLVDGEGLGGKPGANWKDGEKSEGGEDPEMGTSGGPGASKNSDAGDLSEDDDLVDPDADRPDFGSVGDEDGDGEDEDGYLSKDEDEEDASAAARPERQKSRKPIEPAYVTAGIMGAAVLSLALMISFGRGMLMDIWPGFAGFYDSVGMEAEKPGGGLSIAESGKRLMRIDGVETLIVRGFVSNVSDVAKPVPGLRLELYDQRDEVIQTSTGATASALLDPGGTVEFEVRMELPQLDAAQGYKIVWDSD